MYPTQTWVSRNLKYQCRHQAGSENQYWTVTMQWAAFPNVLKLQTYMYYLWDLELQTHTTAAFNTPHVPFFQHVKATDDHFTAKIEQGGKATSLLLFFGSRGSHSLWRTITFLQNRPYFWDITCRCRYMLHFTHFLSLNNNAICFRDNVTSHTYKEWALNTVSTEHSTDMYGCR